MDKLIVKLVIDLNLNSDIVKVLKKHDRKNYLQSHGNKIYNNREDYLSKVKKMQASKKIIPFHIIQTEFDKLIK